MKREQTYTKIVVRLTNGEVESYADTTETAYSAKVADGTLAIMACDHGPEPEPENKPEREITSLGDLLREANEDFERTLSKHRSCPVIYYAPGTWVRVTFS